MIDQEQIESSLKGKLATLNRHPTHSVVRSIMHCRLHPIHTSRFIRVDSTASRMRSCCLNSF